MKIRFATDILRRLGEELNPSIDKGLLELVKNAYDADAINCHIDLTDTDQMGGTVTVADDGDGMMPDDIENGWLVLGRSSKSQLQRTALGRIPAGSKGLGRLAALRMGDQVLLATCPKDDKKTEYTLLIDWTQYENVELVDDVSLDLDKSHRPPGKKPGTEIRIENVRLRIGRREVAKLARELILLADPFGDDPSGFKPTLRAPEFDDLVKLVQRRYFHDADYHLVASVDEKGKGSANILDARGGILFSASHSEIISDPSWEKISCPPLIFDLWTFLLANEKFTTRSVPVSHIRSWLENFGGVHIYQNGLRVTPYGDPGNDWLELNLSRVRSPEERPSTNNSIGRVSFQDSELVLAQKTDRSGFIEADAFQEIKRFSQMALDWMAKRRMEEADKRRDQEKQKVRTVAVESKKHLDSAVEKLPTQVRDPIKKAVEQTWRAVSKQFDHYEQDIQLYRTLSTAGITSATFAHESAGNPIKVIKQAVAAIERRGKKFVPKVYAKQLEKPVSSIHGAVDSLAVLGHVTLNLLGHEKRRPTRVDIHQVINGVITTFAPFLDARKVLVETNYAKGTPFLRGSEAAIESIVTNLVNNSINAFDRSENRDRRVLITTTLGSGRIILQVADSGPGIEGIDKNEIWLPGRTTRKNGTGLGLTIVRDTVKDLGGGVTAREHGDLGGAEIVVTLPILGA